MRSASKREKLFDNLVSKEQIALELGLSVKTVGNWMSSGKLPCLKIGRRNFAMKSMLEVWLEEQRKERGRR